METVFNPCNEGQGKSAESRVYDGTDLWMKNVDALDRRLDVAQMDIISDIDPIVHRSPVHLQLDVGLFCEVHSRRLITLDEQVFHNQNVEITIEKAN